MSAELPCIICARPLESVLALDDSVVINQPSAGTTFITHGHYGSTVFDPASFRRDGPYLEINICDPCLIKAAQQQRVYHCTPQYVQRPDPLLKLWNGEDE